MSLLTVAQHREEVVEVRRVTCTAARCAPSPIEDSTADVVVLPTRGLFMTHLAPSRSYVADPASVLFFASGRPHRVSHPAPGGDDCLVLEFEASTLREALAAAASAESLAGVEPAAVLSPRSVAARARLARHIERLPPDTPATLDVEETALELLAAALRSARRRPVATSPRSDTLAARDGQVNAIRTALAEEPGRPWKLGELAGLVSSSSFHLARVFRDTAGCSIHQYLLRLRVALSVDLLLDTPNELAAIAIDCGFWSHSHFSTSFRRMLGTTPSEFRRANGAAIRQVRKNLKAV